MSELQNKIFQVYKEIKIICETHQLRYYAAGGTKIGAVLWEDIIPWDDDIDLVMPVEDLERLVKIIQDSDNPNIGVFDGLNARYSDIVGVKVYDKHSMFTSNNLINRPDSFTGVFVDIFPMIGVSGDLEDFITKINKIRDSLFKERLFGNSIETTEYLLNKLQKVMHQYSYSKSEYVLNVANPRAELFKRSEFEDIEERKFGSSTIYVSKFYDKHLKQQYGKYTKDWPEEKRIQTHKEFALLDLNRSFEDYQKLIIESPLKDYIEKLWNVKSSLEESVFNIDDQRKELVILNNTQIEINERISSELETLRLLNSELESRLDTVFNSISWKVTKPIRGIKYVFNRIFKRN